MVASADGLATQAGLQILALGGNAVDAAIATNAAIAVTGPHMCGMGGDLFALVHDGSTVHALNASGRAGGGADSAALRSEGRTEMPFRHDIRSVTVPGCVDGWVALHERFARLPLTTLLAPAIRLAEHGFPASPLLVGSLSRLDERGREQLSELATQARRPGDRVRRHGAAAALAAISVGGRDGFYLGPFGDGLLQLGAGWFDRADMQRPGADWTTPLAASAFGRTLHTIAPNSQGYLLLGSALLADQLALPSDPDDAQWAHLLIEAAKAAGRDRPDVLADDADGAALVAAIATRGAEIDPMHAAAIGRGHSNGDTTYLCTVDGDRMGVSLIQSNASNFGSWLVEPNTGINLHNRGMGFSVQAGHPAEVAPGRRPPHTLTPAIASHPDGRLASVFGTMGGDAQPQILLQLAARLFHHEQSPAVAIDAGRWVLNGPVTGFDTWTTAAGPHVLVEGQAPAGWRDHLTARGHEVQVIASFDSAFGHAHAIVVDERTGMLVGAADPRTRIGTVAGM
ncbi:MAG: putative gamma-glutamyltranspeptidase [Ilumatobacteraceae bacterium]|nr:putative gamma-glutamyltranspeptidase [Ilumatobacteraceae bacterium]